jgi:surface protein
LLLSLLRAVISILRTLFSITMSDSPPSPPPSEIPRLFRSFTSTDELYQAVDIYILGLTEDPRDSIVARTYGYPIGTWDVSQVTNFSRVFDPDRDSTFDLLRPPSFNSTFNEDLSGWNVSAAETMFGMFLYANSFNQDLSPWDVSSVNNLSGMFRYATAFNQDLCSWGRRVPASVSVTDMFAESGCPVTDSPGNSSSNLAAGPWCRECPSSPAMMPSAAPLQQPTVPAPPEPTAASSASSSLASLLAPPTISVVSLLAMLLVVGS